MRPEDTATAEMPLAQLLHHLQHLAESALPLWQMPRDARARLINVSENATYLVEAPCGYRAVLRVHRERYHTRRAIECELAWMDALRIQGIVKIPRYLTGHDGNAIQQAQVPGLSRPRYLVLFEFLEGTQPDEDSDMSPGFEQLGQIAARCHAHVETWTKPERFERLEWDVDAVFGPAPTWGNWRDAPKVTPNVRSVLEQVEATVRKRLAAFGRSPSRYNLIHADMRLANLLVNRAEPSLIDFDDCGHGWFMYDFAAAISFIEDDPRVPDLKAAWLRGYQRFRRLDPADIAEIETFVMLRRMALLAWIGSHIEAPEPQALAPGFAQNTARLGQVYLGRING